MRRLSGAVRIFGSHFFGGSQVDRNRACRGNDCGGDIAVYERARHAVRRPRHADGRDDISGVIANWRGDAAHALLALLFIEAVPARADRAQFLQQAGA
jgi:hypothetical protein